MKIDLSRKEYRDLLDIIAIADWVLNAHKVEQDPRTERYRKLEQKFLALSEQMRFENLVEFAPEQDRYFPTKEYEDTSSVQTFVSEYENDTFWEELVARLAERDLAQQIGGYDKIATLTREEMFTRLSQLEEYYSAEFALNGLKNLKVSGLGLSSKKGKTVH